MPKAAAAVLATTSAAPAVPAPAPMQVAVPGALTAPKGAAKRSVAKNDPLVIQYEARKRECRERTARLTPTVLSAVRPETADDDEPTTITTHPNRPTTPPQNRAGRVPRAAALAATQTMSTSSAGVAAASAAGAAGAARSARAGSKRPHEEDEDASGPSTTTTTTPPPLKRQRIGLRVKSS